MTEIREELSPVVAREASFVRNTKVLLLGPALELVGQTGGLRGHIPEPFDVFNHAGNMWGGSLMAVVATCGAITLAGRNDSESSVTTVSEESFSRTRNIAVGVAVGATALINCATETRWGVSHLPVAEALKGPVPDPLDTLYSIGYATLLTVFGWRKIRSASK